MKQKNVILMVVAVGCGLVAAFLTSQMSGKSVEQVEVLVAAKDLPVGTVFTKDELKNYVKPKKVPKEGLPQAVVVNPEELVDKRLSRPIRQEETINPADLNKGVALPDGHDLVSLSVGPSNAASGFVVPGCRVDVMASLRLGNTLKVFELLVNTLVVNVNHDMTNNKNGVYPDINQVGFALTRKQAAVLEMARARGCNLVLKLRNTSRTNEEDAQYNIDAVLKLLEGPQDPTVVKVGDEGKTAEGKQPEPTKPEPTKPEPIKTEPVTVKPAGPDIVPAAPTIPMVQVLVAKKFIEPNTPITNELLKEEFEWKELPKENATDALVDFTEALGKAFKTGVSKGQWVTREMVGLQASKPSPQDQFVNPKPAQENPAPKTDPVKPSVIKPVVPRKFFDVAVHTASGTLIHRYEEIDGKSKLIAVLTPEQAARIDEKADAKAPDNK